MVLTVTLMQLPSITETWPRLFNMQNTSLCFPLLAGKSLPSLQGRHHDANADASIKLQKATFAQLFSADKTGQASKKYKKKAPFHYQYTI